MEPPHGPVAPIAPTPEKTCLLALLAGLAIPAFLIVLKDGMNTKVKSRKDLECLSVPFLGEIPFDKGACNHRSLKGILSRPTRKQRSCFVVKTNSRNLINEAFRMLRTNIEHNFSYDNVGGRMIMVTSVNRSSGKTFIAANLARSLSLTGKRVVLVDLDMRKSKISSYVGLPKTGVTDFLRGSIANCLNLMIHQYGIDILPCGTLPTDPTELLNKDSFTTLIDTLKAEYDYVMIDCPVIEMVAAAAIINRQADLTLLVVRANVLSRAAIRDIDTWRINGRYRNLAIVLNGTSESVSAYCS